MCRYPAFLVILIPIMTALALPDSKHLGSAYGAHTLGRWPAILHGYAFSILHFPLGTAFHAISCCHNSLLLRLFECDAWATFYPWPSLFLSFAASLVSTPFSRLYYPSGYVPESVFSNTGRGQRLAPPVTLSRLF